MRGEVRVVACRGDKEVRDEMGTSTGRQGHAQAGDVSSRCPVLCAGVSGLALLEEKCLTPVLVPGDGEDRGSRLGSPVRGKASLSQDEIILGVHEPNLPSSGPGDHCRGSQEAALTVGEGTAHHLLFRDKIQSAPAFASLAGAPKWSLE